MLTRGAQLGHYEVLEPIGAGGMGEVYRARDPRLGRDVAIKVLPVGTLADEHARKRFHKEAQALARLNHPHIATVHDFDTQEGVDFLVMEHVEGTTLAEKLKSGPLAERELMQVAAQVADALREAHEQGIVHRDLKPGNLKLTPRGQVKVLDFGLAKLLPTVGPGFSQGATTESFTESHLLAGTLPYMSPEHLQGEAVDARSDLYSFGVVLYELATGRRPFEQKVSTALSDAILHQAPPSPARLKHDLSARLEEIILKCLEKDPERRYQSAKELGVDLRRLAAPTAISLAPSPQAPAWGRIGSWWQVPPGSAWRVAVGLAGIMVVVAVVVGLDLGGLRERLFGTATPKIESLAVLPLENLSRDPEQDYFADGMTEALIADLAKISALRVISRTSVMQYKGVRRPLPEIARELNVDAVIEGSVQRVGERVRITAQLIHARTDTHLWAESYERDLRDVLALQSEVAHAIANEIRVKLTPQEVARLGPARPVKSEAHEAYLQGRYYWNKRSREGLEKSLEYFQRAIEIDPTYALAYAGMAHAYNTLADSTDLAPTEACPKARAASLKALEIDEYLGEAHASLALVKLNYDWDWAGAEREFKRAIELSPNYAGAHQWYGLYLSAMGRSEEAIAEEKRAHELDPLSLIMYRAAGVVFHNARRYDEEIEQYRKALEMDPNFRPALIGLGQALAEKGMFEQAITELTRLRTLTPGWPPSTALLASTLARAGRRRDALKLLGELKAGSEGRYVSALNIAMVYAALADRDQAFAWLEKAYGERSSFLYTLKVRPWMDPLRSDPRFQDLLRRMNLPP